uniref:Uncharacterized protein n=1 Tax=Rhizophora mucronata TaxID=61149 RepID=A0A2P2R0S6_RHIMU
MSYMISLNFLRGRQRNVLFSSLFFGPSPSDIITVAWTIQITQLTI